MSIVFMQKFTLPKDFSIFLMFQDFSSIISFLFRKFPLAIPLG